MGRSFAPLPLGGIQRTNTQRAGRVMQFALRYTFQKNPTHGFRGLYGLHNLCNLRKSVADASVPEHLQHRTNRRHAG
jgi:hypothetical protein